MSCFRFRWCNRFSEHKSGNDPALSSTRRPRGKGEISRRIVDSDRRNIKKRCLGTLPTGGDPAESEAIPGTAERGRRIYPLPEASLADGCSCAASCRITFAVSLKLTAAGGAGSFQISGIDHRSFSNFRLPFAETPQVGGISGRPGASGFDLIREDAPIVSQFQTRVDRGRNRGRADFRSSTVPSSLRQ